MLKVILSGAAGLLCALSLQAETATEASYPTRPMTMIIPYAVGGGADLIARAVGNSISRTLMQPVTYDNKTGASGMIAAAAVAKSQADGYTMLLMTDNMYTTNPRFFGKPAEDGLAGLEPVSNLVGAPVVIAVGGSSSLQNLEQLVAYAKSKDRPLTYATPGVGTPHQLAAELLARAAGVQFTHVPYKGTAGAMTDLSSGRLDLLFGMQATIQPMTDAGKARIIAVTPNERFPLLPSVPSVSEVFPGVAVSMIDIGLVVPRGTPPGIVRKLNGAVQTALSDPDIVALMRANGMVPAGGSASEYGARMRDSRREREMAIEATGIKMGQ
ncbi:MAG: tripartite tricarboxylate transporter substrate binding protein [Burkholderiaceae bacterium]|nr:tripartite tricarboxylate transporter substrate binding protein [Burkholderiaceae bacterium]